MRVASLVNGIFFKSKIGEAVSRIGDNTFCSNYDDVMAAEPNIVIVDLEHPESHLVLREFGSKAIAFGPHLRADLLAVAREFGAQAYPRSVFFSQIDNLLHRHT